VQINKQSFHVNIIELTDKMSWFGRMWSINIKAMTLPLVVLACQIYRKEWLLERLRTREGLIRPEAPGSKRDRPEPNNAPCPAHHEPSDTHVWMVWSPHG
jgi:hypothetical protein